MDSNQHSGLQCLQAAGQLCQVAKPASGAVLTASSMIMREHGEAFPRRLLQQSLQSLLAYDPIVLIIQHCMQLRYWSLQCHH